MGGLECSSGLLGPTWGHLGAILGHLRGHLRGHLGHLGADLGPTWAILRSSSVPSWGSWRSSWIILDLARKFGRRKCVSLDEVAQKWHCDVPQRRWQAMATDGNRWQTIGCPAECAWPVLVPVRNWKESDKILTSNLARPCSP